MQKPVIFVSISILFIGTDDYFTLQWFIKLNIFITLWLPLSCFQRSVRMTQLASAFVRTASARFLLYRGSFVLITIMHFFQLEWLKKYCFQLPHTKLPSKIYTSKQVYTSFYIVSPLVKWNIVGYVRSIIETLWLSLCCLFDLNCNGLLRPHPSKSRVSMMLKEPWAPADVQSSTCDTRPFPKKNHKIH